MDQKEFFKTLTTDPDNFEELKECPWCGDRGYDQWGEQSYEGFLTVQCRGCSVVYVRRRLNALGRKRLCNGYMEVRQEPERARMREKAHDLELNFMYRHIGSGRVLDIGCGGGYLLERMPNEKWDRWGTELGADAVARARQVLGDERVFEGEIEDLDLPKSHFDLVIARGVIEHVPSPRRFLEKAVSLIKTKGYLFMSGPNLDSFCAQFYKDRWRLHYPEAHLFHFSLRHFNEFLGGRGFRLVSDAYHYLETPYAVPEEDILQIARDIEAKRYCEIHKLSPKSPPFFGNRYTAIWNKEV